MPCNYSKRRCIIESELAEESKSPTATDICCVMPIFGHATEAATERSLSRISAAVKPSKSLQSSELAYYKLSEPDAGIWWLNLFSIATLERLEESRRNS